jgi:hypothetical protein
MQEVHTPKEKAPKQDGISQFSIFMNPDLVPSTFGGAWLLPRRDVSASSSSSSAAGSETGREANCPYQLETGWCFKVDQ